MREFQFFSQNLRLFLCSVFCLFSTQFLPNVSAQQDTNLPPQIVDHSDPDIKIQNGASTVVKCTIRYLGSYTVTFQRLSDGKNGQVNINPLTKGTTIYSPDHLDKYQVRHDDQSETWELTINKLTEEDEGIIECAVQTQPPTRQQFMITVEEPPIIINEKTSKDFSVKEYDEMELKCDATGDPKPEITWTRHGGAPLPIGGQEWKGPVMHVHRVLREDRGTYVCEARNSAGSIQRDINVEVQFAPSIEFFRPVIVEHVDNRYRRQQGYTEIGGSYAELDCDVIAAPRLQGDGVYWYVLDQRTQGRNRIEPKKNPEKYHILTIPQANNEVISKLTIKNFVSTDFRTYVCEAKNVEGSKEETIPLNDRRDADYVVIDGSKDGWSGGGVVLPSAPLVISVGTLLSAILMLRN